MRVKDWVDASMSDWHIGDMSRYGLTAQEQKRRRRALRKIRNEIFRLRRPDDCWIQGRVNILPPRIDVRVEPDSGKRVTTVTYGGLEFRVAIPLSPHSHCIGVKHWDGDRFLMYAGYTHSERSASYTNFSRTVPFSMVGDVFCAWLDAIAAESKKSWDQRERASVRPPQ